jgi:hypothetical protein
MLWDVAYVTITDSCAVVFFAQLITRAHLCAKILKHLMENSGM